MKAFIFYFKSKIVLTPLVVPQNLPDSHHHRLLAPACPRTCLIPITIACSPVSGSARYPSQSPAHARCARLFTIACSHPRRSPVHNRMLAPAAAPCFSRCCGKCAKRIFHSTYYILARLRRANTRQERAKILVSHHHPGQVHLKHSISNQRRPNHPNLMTFSGLDLMHFFTSIRDLSKASPDPRQ